VSAAAACSGGIVAAHETIDFSGELRKELIPVSLDPRSGTELAQQRTQLLTLRRLSRRARVDRRVNPLEVAFESEEEFLKDKTEPKAFGSREPLVVATSAKI
jgi:hypothetical protein